MYEKDIICLEAWERILHDPEWNEKLWEPMRRGRPVRAPQSALIIGRPGSSEIELQFEGSR